MYECLACGKPVRLHEIKRHEIRDAFLCKGCGKPYPYEHPDFLCNLCLVEMRKS